MVFDLEERTKNFGLSVIRLIKKMPQTAITDRLIRQLVGAATAIGANYCEADCAESGRDFVHKLAIANKEAKETRFFLGMIKEVVPELESEITKLEQEAYELNMIMSSIIKKIKNKQR